MDNISDSHDDLHVHIPWYQQRLLWLVSGSVTIAFCLVLVAMALYASSGSAQLDISRPGYKSVQDKVDSTTFESFPATGDVDKKAIDDFLELYDKQTKRVNSTDAFSDSALSDAALGIGAP